MSQPKLTIRFAAVLMAALMLLPTFGAAAASDIEVSPQVEGMGTAASPIRLGNAEDLKHFAQRYNDGAFKDMGEDGVLHAVLSADIDMAGVETAPIGTEARPFDGVFDGAGHAVENLAGAGGLFGVVSGGAVRNLALVGVAVSAEGDAGAVANVVKNGTVERVYASGTVAGAGNVGGLVGRLENAILQSGRSDAEVTHTGVSGAAGGLAGAVSGGTIAASYATGRLEAGAGVSAGGAAGKIQNAATATDLVALQAVVNGGTATHRVAGELAGGVVSGLRGWAGMWLNGAAGSATDPGAAKPNGADATTAALANTAVNFWAGTAFDGANGWRARAGELPVLESLAAWQSDALPDYFDPASGYPYKTLVIEDEAGFAAFAKAVNDGDSHAGTLVKLEDDLVLSGTAITAQLPIGKNGTLFAGVLDGGGHTLAELSITGGAKVGLFSELKDATVRNLRLGVVSVTGGANVGALVGSVAAGGSVRIENCAAFPGVYGSPRHVSGTGSVGGLVGSAGAATIIGCESSVSPGSSGGPVGGIAGSAGAGATIGNSMFAGSIDTKSNTGTTFVGGIVGDFSGSEALVEACFVINTSANSISVAGGASAGGIAGRVANGAILRDVYNINLTVQSETNTVALGGLAGTVSGGLVEFGYAAAGVSGGGGAVGGLAGKLASGASQPGTVKNSVSLASSVGAIPRVAPAAGTAGTDYLLQNNYAWKEMNPGISASDANGPHGAAVEVAKLLSGEGFYDVTGSAGGFADIATWSIQAGRLPILVAAGHGQQGTVPAYLSAAAAMKGNGTEEDPLQIVTAAHLFKMASEVNSGGYIGNVPYYEAYYLLMGDIDMDAAGLNTEGKAWTSAGDGSIGFVFEGVFDGGGHAIRNLNVPYVAGDEAGGGLFGTLKNATVKNLTLESPVVQKMKLPGAVAGSATGSTIEHCTVKNLSLELYTSGAAEGAGFLVGSAKNTDFIACRAEGDFSENVSMAGGIVGSLTGGSIVDSSFEGSIAAAGSVGGLAGYASGAAISGGAVLADVRAMSYGGGTDAPQYAGGIVGDAAGTSIARSTWRGRVDAGQSAGGIAGRMVYGSVTQSHSCGNVTAGKYAGGIAGSLAGAAASHCYTTGVVLAGESHAGGIAGIVQAGTYNKKKYGGSITSCYSTAQVEAQGGYAGGLAGQLAANASGQSGKNTLKNSVAVNVSVKSTTGAATTGRLTGGVGSGTTVTGCHAPTTIGGIDASKTGKNQGAAVGLAALARPTFWQGLGFTPAAGWQQAASSLPILSVITPPDGWSGSLPFHLTGYATQFELTAWQDGRQVEQVDMGAQDREVELRMTAAEGQQWTEFETSWQVIDNEAEYAVYFDRDTCFGQPAGWGEAVVCAITVPAGYKGPFTVTATDKNSGGSASVTLRVVERAAGVRVSPSVLALDTVAGENEGTLTAEVLSAGADGPDDKSVTWKSSNTKVATVDTSGIVKALAYGTAMITATTGDGGFTASAAVRVAPTLAEGDLGLSKTVQTLNVGKSATLKPTYKNSKVTVASLEWAIVAPAGAEPSGFDAEAIATVDAAGKVTGKGPGQARVALTATTVAGAQRTVYCDLTVKLPATAMNIVDAQHYKGNDFEYDAGLLLNKKTVRLVTAAHADAPENPATATDLRLNRDTLWLAPVLAGSASNDTVKWTVSDKKGAVVEVVKDGSDGGPLVLRAKGVGTATVTATAALGKKSAKVTVRVVEPVASLSIQKTTAGAYDSDLAVGASVTLKADALGAGGAAPTNKKVTWESSDPSVAAINATSGKVTGKTAGKWVTITASSQDLLANGSPAATASCLLYVVAPVKTAKTNQAAFTLPSGAAYEADARYQRALSLNLNGGGPVTYTDPRQGGDYITCNWTIPDGAPLVFVDGEGRETATSTDLAPTLRVKTSAPLEKNATATIAVKVQSKGAKAVSASVKVTVLSAANSKNYVPVQSLAFKNTAGDADGVLTLLVGKTFKPTLNYNGGGAAPSDKNVAWSATMTGSGEPWEHISIDRTSGTIKGLASTWEAANPNAQYVITLTATPADNPAAAATYKVKVLQRAASVRIAADEGRNTLDVSREAGLYGKQTLTLRATLAPAGLVSDEAVAWSSAQKGKTVDWSEMSDGSIVVKGLKAGSATIKATAKDGSKKSGSFKVTVVQQVDSFGITIPAKHKVAEGQAAMDRGQSATMKLVFNAGLKSNQPKNKAVAWTTSDPSVATVSTKGVVKAVGDGTAVITATPVDTVGEAAPQSLRVTVTAKATKVAMQQKKFSLYAGRQVTISAATTPEIAELSAGQDTLLWTVANHNLLGFVDENGNPIGDVVGTTTKKNLETAAGAQGITLLAASAGVDGKLPGGKTSATCRVTATAKSGKSASVDIVVTSVRKSAAQVQEVRLNKNGLWLQKGKSETLKATLTGEVLPGATKATAPGNKNLVWEVASATDVLGNPVSDPATVAVVSSTGKVTVKGQGLVWVRVRAVDGYSTTGWKNEATCVVYCLAKN